MDLAAQLPAAVLSRLLGLTIGAAELWNQHAGANSATYAAKVSRRSQPRP